MTRETFCYDCGMTLVGYCSHPQCPKRPQQLNNIDFNRNPNEDEKTIVQTTQRNLKK